MEELFDDIEILISKVLAGEASPEEQQRLEGWLSEKEENRAYFRQLEMLFEKSASLKAWQEFDTDAAWMKVKASLPKKQKQVFFNPFEFASAYWHVAASVILAVGILYLSYDWFIRPEREVTIASNEKIINKKLPDGTQTFLNKNSVVDYEYSPVEKKRKVKLEGEAYFKIADKKEKPFVIRTDEVIIEDIGTTFNVEAYPDSQYVKVFVETGEVAFYTLENPGLRLVAGETGIYDKASKSFARLSIVDENVIAYKTNIFVFRDTRMKDVIETLNEVYDRKLVLENESIAECRITVTFKNETIDVIADIIAETLKLKTVKSKEKITLQGNGCHE